MELCEAYLTLALYPGLFFCVGGKKGAWLPIDCNMQPQAVYAAFTHGMTSKWLYLSHTMKDISSILQPLEQTIRTKLIPALRGRPRPKEFARMFVLNLICNL